MLGGANGAGKSSLHEKLRVPGAFVNADRYARRLDPEHPDRASRQAGKLVLRRLARLVETRSDFAYETTLSSHQSLVLMRKAREAGYEIGLVYVVLSDVDLNVDRVADRVRRGGHAIAEPMIRRRYEKSLRRLGPAIRLAHGSLVYDNSSTVPELVVRIRGNRLEENLLDGRRPAHVLLADVIASALDLRAASVLPFRPR